MVGLVGLGLFALYQKPVYAATPGTINFQGKVVNIDGTNVTNGPSSITFRIYYNIDPTTYDPNAISLCSSDANCYWEETQASVSVTNGVFQVELGKVCVFTGACNSGGRIIDFNALNGYYLTMKYAGDSQYMKPLVHLQSVPFAFNSNKLNGLDSSAFGQLTAANIFQPTTNVTGMVVKQTSAGSPTANIFNVQTANGTNILQATGPSANNSVVTLQSVGSGNALTLTSAAATTWSTSAGLLTLQGASGITLTATGANALTLDSGSSGTISIGGTSATTTVGRSGAALTLNGSNFSVSAAGNITSQTSSYTTDQLLINDGQITAHPAYPNSYTPALSVVTNETTGSRPLFFGYNNAGAWDGFLTTGACGSFTQMCLDLGSGSTAYTALQSSGTTLSVGNGSDGDFSNIVIGSTVTGTTQIQSASGLILGKSSTANGNGTLVFDNATNANTITLVSGATAASYSLTMPTAAPSGSAQCLQTSGSATQLAFAACVGDTLQNVYDASGTPATITTTAAKGVKIAAGAVPTVDMLTIDNSSYPETNVGIAAMQVNYVGGNTAVEASAVRFDFTPGGMTGGTWNGLRIVANATGAVAGVNEYGLKLEGPTSPGAGTEKAVYIGTGWDIGLDIQSGGLQLLAQTDPAAPAASNLRIYAKAIAGRIMPKWIAPSGVDTPFQASFGFNRIAMLTPSGLAAAAAATVFNAWGVNPTQSASTYTNPALASTNLFTAVRRGRLTSTATAGALAYSYSTSLMAWRGNAAGLGGFFFTVRFGTSTLASGNRVFVGLTDSTSAPTNIDPTTNITPGMLGMAINASTGNWNWINNVTGSAPTVTGLGANFPVNTTSLYELVMYSPPNGSSITYRITNLSTAAVTSDTVVSTNIPGTTTFLAPRFWATNNLTAAAVAIDCTGWYLESDD